MNWEVFYSPHTDDETIGMAGAIVNARELGHAVLVCLVTDNQPSTRGRNLFPLHDLAEQRRIEFRRALSALGVTEWEAWEIPEVDMPSRTVDIRAMIRDRMAELHMTRTVVHHHTTWGMWDQNAGVRCLAHDLCASAAFDLSYTAPDVRVSLYGIYEYSKPKEQRSAPKIRPLSKLEHAKKRDALSAYYPKDKAIGYGYTSVPELMDAAWEDPREFIVEVTSAMRCPDA